MSSHNPYRAVRRIGVRELKEHTSEVVRAVRESRETYEVTHRGEVVARIVPVQPDETDEDIDARIATWEELGRKISEKWPTGVSAVEAVREQRREL